MDVELVLLGFSDASQARGFRVEGLLGLVSGSVMGIAGVTSGVIGVMNLLTKSP